MPRAIYAPAAFVGSTPTTLTLSVPNAAHRAKCEQHRAAVEAALREFAGVVVKIQFVEGDGGGGGEREVLTPGAADVAAGPAIALPASSPAAEHAPTVERVESVLPDDDDVDLDDLTDAPPESVKSPIERLAEAFPGSELIEEAG
jgi:DNA polymerase-3 subunit gamma/tau